MGLVSSPIDISQLPAPDALEVIDFEAIYESRKNKLIDLFPVDVQDEVRETLKLESEPMVKLLQENSYRELVIRQRINECVRRVLLAFAKGSDLDHIGARYFVKRLVVQPADLDAIPPQPEILESDDALLERIQDAYEGLSIAGPRGAYIFHTRSADGRVADAQAFSPEPCEVVVSVLSHEDDGTASEELLNVVRKALNDEEIRPLGDRVTVQSSIIVDYAIEAILHMKSYGPGNELALAQAIDNITQFVNRRNRQGWSVWVDKLDALMHVEGVEHVERIEPLADILLDETQAARCTAINITIAALDADVEPEE